MLKACFDPANLQSQYLTLQVREASHIIYQSDLFGEYTFIKCLYCFLQSGNTFYPG